MNRTPLIVLVAALVGTTLVLVLAGARTDGGRTGTVVTVPAAAATPDASELRAVSSATGVPTRALEAYVAASRRLEADDPGCRLAWNTLAGIGASESSHGSFGGAALDADGRATPRIIGVPLDGTGGNRAIRDTDGGRLDGDTTWDRAVGPMQFIPTTWAVWGSSAEDSGRPDPHDIDDAALAAGRYLCDAGGDLGSSRGWTKAVLTYNASTSYARKVARTATDYAESL